MTRGMHIIVLPDRYVYPILVTTSMDIVVYLETIVLPVRNAAVLMVLILAASLVLQLHLVPALRLTSL